MSETLIQLIMVYITLLFAAVAIVIMVRDERELRRARTKGYRESLTGCCKRHDSEPSNKEKDGS